MDENSIYQELFFEETDTYLSALNKDVLLLEEKPEDIDIINAIFRSAHTLKGMASTMGYDTMAKLTHQIESLFQLLKDKELTVEHDTISLIFKCLDTLSEIVENLRDGGDGKMDVTAITDQLIQVTNQSPNDNHDDKAVTKLVPALNTYTRQDIDKVKENINHGYNAFVVMIQLKESTMMKGVRAAILVSDLENHGQILISEPNEDLMMADDFDGLVQVLLLTKLGEEDLQKILLDDSDVNLVSITEALKVLKEPEEKQELSQTKKQQPVSGQRQMMRIDPSRLDLFMTLVSEMVIHRSRLESLTVDAQNPEVSETLTEIEKITTELQEVVVGLRMQPFSVATQRFPRMIRDLADDLQKDLKLVIEGEETELDRTVVSEIGEPLVHLLRNSADHGIEDPDVRESLGKSRQGIITVSAYQSGNRVIVSVKDDGKGMNPLDIKESAERKGLSTDGLSDDEILQLIFHPGFSTKTEVTGVSGRGVGMDAVKEKINRLNGTIEMESIVNEGTTFSITLPLTLSIIQSLLVKAGGQTYAIPQNVIEKVEEYNLAAISTTHQCEMYAYQDEYIPVIYLSKRLGYQSHAVEKSYVIISNNRNKRHALVIDELLEQQEIVIKELGLELRHLKEYLGATILGNGEVALILDIASLSHKENMK